ncbi:MAG: prepilin-type N-terminal cleavage/methylation domain-containing protein [Victivallaceae bacterium]|nr:prepilin-type N-terminal cleavage/methylation domain-containing protein [Victivallaceae bacterium]
MKKFTLVELLVVISIIGILAGIILPIVAGSNKRALVLQAQTDVSAIKMAIEKYANDNHGKLPVCFPPFVDKTTGKVAGAFMDEKTGRLTDRGYDVLTQLLSGVDIEYDASKENLDDSSDETANDTSKHADWSKVNPRKVAYLDVSQGFAINGLRDPWDNRYVIIFDYENTNDQSTVKYPNNKQAYPLDEELTHPALNGSISLFKDDQDKNVTVDKDELTKKNLASLLRAPLLVYSKGANGKDTGGLGSEFHPDFDDINSWSSM